MKKRGLKNRTKQEEGSEKKLRIGFFSFTGCEGCQFTVLFLDKIMDVFSEFDVQYFHLIKEKNREVNFDIAFVEGAITSKREKKKLKKIRGKSRFLIAMGACACEGGVPSMRNFIESTELAKYVYSQSILDDSIAAQPISAFVKVDYFMRGCPILKKEFLKVLYCLKKGENVTEPKGNVCSECSRKGKDNCFLVMKKPCTGAITHGGCKAICIEQNIPCMLCRGPLTKLSIGAEMKLFKKMGGSCKTSREISCCRICFELYRFCGIFVY